MLCATSTVAAGVNLPARRVVFRDAWVAQPDKLITATQYQQMAGRAGRAGERSGEGGKSHIGIHPYLFLLISCRDTYY